MQIADEHAAHMEWVQNYYGNYHAWYEHVRDVIVTNSGIPLFDLYSNYTKQQCLDRISHLQSSIQDYLTFLHPWAYSIVSNQVRIDLLYHRICVICSEERDLEDRQNLKNSKKKVVINSDLSISFQ